MRMMSSDCLSMECQMTNGVSCVLYSDYFSVTESHRSTKMLLAYDDQHIECKAN